MTTQTYIVVIAAVVPFTFLGCNSSNDTRYCEAQSVVAAEEARLDSLRADLQRVVKNLDDHRQFVILSNQFIADDDRMENIESRMEKPFTKEYLAVRASAKGDRETIRSMLYPRAQKLDRVGEEYKAAVAAVEAQEQRVADAVALRNKYAPDPTAVPNDPVVVEARRQLDAAGIYDRMALPLNGTEVVEALRKRGFDLQESKRVQQTIYTMFDGRAEIFFLENLGKTRVLIVSVDTNHTDAVKRQRSMELGYAVGAVILKLSNEEAEKVIGKAVSDASNLGAGSPTGRIYGYCTEAATVHAFGTDKGYSLRFFPSLLMK